MPPDVTYRPATEGDVEAQLAVFNHAQGGLYREHHFERPDTPIEGFGR